MWTDMKYQCPACGNTNRSFITDNNLSKDSPDFILLCLAQVDKLGSCPDDPDSDDMTCGMQWQPNGND